MYTGIQQLQEKIKEYKHVLALTDSFRLAWKEKTKTFIKKQLQSIIDQTGLKATVTEKNNIENLEAVVLDLGRRSSGLAHMVDDSDVQHIMVKDIGAVIYQQLFNGKIMVMIISPHIEGHGDPKPPSPIAILKPEEITEAAIYTHVEQMLDVLIEWEDYDDEDKSAKRAFQPIGFRHTVPGEQVN
jgi:hypothetical protein